MTLELKNFRIVDEDTDTAGTLFIEDGIITEFTALACTEAEKERLPVLMPAFVDLHAHFRDPGFPEKEVLESACLAAATGGYGTVVCMANTMPVTDTAEKAAAIKRRADALELIDVYPAISLTRNMEGRELSAIKDLEAAPACTRLLSEDGRDVSDPALFLEALREAGRLGLPVSCHCDFGGEAAVRAKELGRGRGVWSRLEENHATERALALNREALCRLHIAHVSTKEAAELVRQEKRSGSVSAGLLSAEACPHHIACTAGDAAALGEESWGRVNPPLREEEDRRAIIAAIADGTIDAIATDHAPHTAADKERGAPGFSGLETAFSVCYSELVYGGRIDLKKLSALMSANPARILGLERGKTAAGTRADLVIADINNSVTVDPEMFKSRGKNSPFRGKRFSGVILATINRGRVVYCADGIQGEKRCIISTDFLRR